KYDLIRSETMMPGMGKVAFERCTREEALAPCVGPDINWNQSIKLKQQLISPHSDAAIVYRVKVDTKKKLETLFANDERQTVKLVGDGIIELTVRQGHRPPEKLVAIAGPPGDEFTTSNFFITSDDARVKQHAANAVGGETDPWKKALLIERWV